MPLRVAAVLGGYLVYRFFERPLVPGIMLGLGFVLVAWAAIERFTTFRRDRPDAMFAGQAILGIGLVGVGAFLAAR